MSGNSLFHIAVRPLVKAIAHTRITPNHVTTLRLVTGLVAAIFFALGSREAMLLGSLIFFLSMFLDRADGELARQTGRTSRFGYWYDICSDCVTGVAAFAGLGIGLAGTFGPIGYLLGTLAALGIGTMFFLLYAQKVVPVKSARVGGRIDFDPDDALVLVPILVACGFAFPMVVAASVIAPLLAAGLVFLWLKGRLA